MANRVRCLATFPENPYATTFIARGKSLELAKKPPPRFAMTMDASLKVKAGAIKTRNVLTRAERVRQMQKQGTFDQTESVVGMPKVRVIKVSLKKKKKVKKADDDKK